MVKKADSGKDGQQVQVIKSRKILVADKPSTDGDATISRKAADIAAGDKSTEAANPAKMSKTEQPAQAVATKEAAKKATTTAPITEEPTPTDITTTEKSEVGSSDTLADKPPLQPDQQNPPPSTPPTDDLEALRRQYRIPIDKVAKKMHRRRGGVIWLLLLLALAVTAGYLFVTPEALDPLIDFFSPAA